MHGSYKIGLGVHVVQHRSSSVDRVSMCLGALSLSAELSVKMRLFESMLCSLVPHHCALCEWV